MALLTGYSIRFLEASFAKKRLEILKRLVQDNGGALIDRGGILLADARKDQVIDGGFDHLDTVYSADWISDSIAQKRLQNLEEYKLAHPAKKVKLNTTTGPKIVVPEGFVNTTFDCFRPTPLDHLNGGLVEALSKIARQRYLTGNARSELSYNRAIAVIKSYPKEIESVEEAEPLMGIGPKILGYVGEYLDTGRIRAADECETEEVKILESFVRIHGVGPKTAQSWIDLGIRSVEELKAAVAQGDVKLQEDQRIGLKYYDDFCLKMSRTDVKEIIDMVQAALDRVFGDKVVLVEATGGYRRGKTENGDADLLIHAIGSSPSKSQIMAALLKELRSTHIKEILSHSDKKGSAKSLELCFVAWQTSEQNPMRRVDFILADHETYPYAMLGWTGSRQFERSLRLYAQKKHGITLTDHGMSRNGIGIEREEQIFEALGVPYLPPHMRNC